jgi:hypothetical protein
LQAPCHLTPALCRSKGTPADGSGETGRKKQEQQEEQVQRLVCMLWVTPLVTLSAQVVVVQAKTASLQVMWLRDWVLQ